MISFVIPVYNEREESVRTVIEEVKRIGERSRKPFEVIVINDGSTDGSNIIIQQFKDIKIINHDYNQGYGASLKTGIQNSQGNWIGIIDADQSYPVEMFLVMIKEIDKFDIIIGSRTGKDIHLSFLRRFAKYILKKIAYILTHQNIPDINSGMQLFKKEIAIRFLKLFPDNFSFTTTLTIAASCNNYKLKFIPINYYKRKGKSHIHPIRDFFAFFRLIIRLTVYFKPLNIFFPISSIFFLIGVTKMIIDAVRFSHFGIGGVALVLMGLQILFLGLLADLIIRRTDL